MTNHSLETTGSPRDGHAEAPHVAEAGTSTVSDISVLVEKARAGDQRALERVLAEARPRALAVAMKVLRNPVDAEDAVQDALVKVWRSMPRFEGRASFFTWIHRIVMNAALDVLRRQKARVDVTDNGEATDAPAAVARDLEPSHDDTPERHMIAVEVGALVRQALDALPALHREPLALFELEGHSYDEIARAVACPVGTVMSRLHHARRKFADEIVARVRDDERDLLVAA